MDKANGLDSAPSSTQQGAMDAGEVPQGPTDSASSTPGGGDVAYDWKQYTNGKGACARVYACVCACNCVWVGGLSLCVCWRLVAAKARHAGYIPFSPPTLPSLSFNNKHPPQNRARIPHGPPFGCQGQRVL